MISLPLFHNITKPSSRSTMHGNLEDIVWTPWLSMMVWWLDDVDNYNDGDFGSLDDKDGYGVVDDVGVKYC